MAEPVHHLLFAIRLVTQFRVVAGQSQVADRVQPLRMYGQGAGTKQSFPFGGKGLRHYVLDRYFVELHRFVMLEMGFDRFENDRAGSAAVQLRVHPKRWRIRRHSAIDDSSLRSREPLTTMRMAFPSRARCVPKFDSSQKRSRGPILLGRLDGRMRPSPHGHQFHTSINPT